MTDGVDLSAFLKNRTNTFKKVMEELKERTFDLRFDLDFQHKDWSFKSVPSREWILTHDVIRGDRWVLSPRALAPPPPKAPPAPPVQTEIGSLQLATLRLEVLPELIDRTTWLRRGLDKRTADVIPIREQRLREKDTYGAGTVYHLGEIKNGPFGWWFNLEKRKDLDTTPRWKLLVAAQAQK